MSERWAQVRTLLESVLSMPPQDRAAWLAGQTGIDADITGEVRRLLDNVEADDGALDRPAWAGVAEPNTSRNFELGETFAERYTIIRFLGSGGMGEVYGCLDKQTGDRPAIKTLRSEWSGDRAYEARLQRELDLAKRITHPNVCRVDGFGQGLDKRGRSIFYVTMEWLDGQTLAEHIATNALPYEQALTIAHQLALGLDAAHAEGIIHRDFKSANIILCPDILPDDEPGKDQSFRSVITDFGLARDSLGAQTTILDTGAIAGTPAYMSPEQLDGAKATKASDIYSLGVVLFEMVTGRLPFEGGTPLAIALRRVQGEAPLVRTYNPSLPAAWDSVLADCLSRDIEARPKTARELVERLERPYLPPISRPVAPVAKPITRRFVLTTAAGFATVASAGLGVWRWDKQTPRELPAEARIALKKGQEFAKRRNEEGVRNAIVELERATTLAPYSTQAWNSLAEAYLSAANYMYLPSDQALAKARQAGESSLKIKSYQARVYGVLGTITAYEIPHWREAEPYFRKAVAIDPNDPVLRGWYGNYLGRLGKHQEALDQINKGLDIDPTLQALHHNLAAQFLRMRRYPEFLTQSYELVRIQPREGSSHLTLARAYERLRRFAEALAACDEADRYGYSILSECMRACIMAGQGQATAARQIGEKVEKHWRNNEMQVLQLAYVYAVLKDAPKVIELITEGLKRGDTTVLGIPTSPYFDVFRGYQPYERFRASLGFSAMGESKPSA